MRSRTLHPSPKKKSRNTQAFILVAGGVVLLIIVFATSNPSQQQKSASPPPPKSWQGVAVNLPESQKREMYASLFSLRGMLRQAGGDPRRSYQVLADRYSVPVETVRAVEEEGNGKGWSKSE